MPVQDDAREQQMTLLFNLSVPENRQRADIDAMLELDDPKMSVPFELKSTTGKSVATVRDFGPQHIAKWRNLHWLFAFYASGAESKPLYCLYASPADMAPWIAEKESYIRPDLVLAERAPQRVTEEDLAVVLGVEKNVYTTADAKAIMKQQWSAEQYRKNADLGPGGYSRAKMLEVLQERCGYVIRRGATLNNPHIPGAYLDRLAKIVDRPAKTLEALVKAYLVSQREAEAEGQSLLPPLDPFTEAQAKASATEEATA